MTLDQVNNFLNSQKLCCSHYDAFRFFTPEARSMNNVELGIDDRMKYLVTEVEETGKAMNELIDTLPLPCRSCKKFNCNDGKCWGFWQSPSSSTSTT